MPVVLVTVVPLQVLRILFVFENMISYFLPDLYITELRRALMTVHWYCIVQGPIYVGSGRHIDPHTVGGGIWNHRGNRGGSGPHNVEG